MRDTRVEEVEQISSDSDSDETDKVVLANGGPPSLPDSTAASAADATTSKSKQPTIGIFPNHVQQGPTYLIFQTHEDKEKYVRGGSLLHGHRCD